MTKPGYVHGYSDRESSRLSDQANTLDPRLHGDTSYPPGSAVLECGCGTGAQTHILARNSPEARITSVDLSQDSLEKASALIDATGALVYRPRIHQVRALLDPAAREPELREALRLYTEMGSAHAQRIEDELAD